VLHYALAEPGFDRRCIGADLTRHHLCGEFRVI
jgi:hypothetical protein